MSIEKSFMRPKRASKTFTKTRRDCQIKSSSFPEGGVGFLPIPCGQNRYRLELENSRDNICDVGDLAEEIHQSSGLAVNVVQTVLATLLDVVPKFIARTNGSAVRLGNLVTLKPCITGTIDYANGTLDSKKNHLEIRATESPALRHSLAKAPLVNNARSTNGLDRVMGGQDNTKRDKIDVENTLQIHGKNIYVTPHQANADCGGGRVWIEARDGRRLGACSVELPTGPDLITARFVPDAPMREEDRDCRVVVETYATKEAAESDKPRLLFRLTRDVTYIGPCASQ